MEPGFPGVLLYLGAPVLVIEALQFAYQPSIPSEVSWLCPVASLADA